MHASVLQRLALVLLRQACQPRGHKRVELRGGDVRVDSRMCLVRTYVRQSERLPIQIELEA